MSTTGGKNYKKFKKESKVQEEAKYNISKADFPDSIYAKVTSMLGNGRLMAKGEDNKDYNCVIRGRMYKKIWIGKDDYIIISPRDYEKNNNADVLHKLTEDELNQFEIKGIFIIAEENAQNKDEFDFDDL